MKFFQISKLLTVHLQSEFFNYLESILLGGS